MQHGLHRWLTDTSPERDIYSMFQIIKQNGIFQISLKVLTLSINFHSLFITIYLTLHIHSI